ncbi:MAG: helicase-related protein [Gemmataceae bacterium]
MYIAQALRQEQQAYVVCPLVEESEKLEVVSAQKAYQDLAEGPFREFRLGLLHGRMDETEKAEVMRQFRSRELDLLVCTTVIEVGVDVPNATWMVIEHAERFGLSQLHQLRGRVSRGMEAGRCFLFAETASEESRDRLEVFLRTTDGFELAEEDVRLRGMGELFGARQHGAGELGWMGLPSMDILQKARTDAFELVRHDPGLRQSEHSLLRAAVLERYGGTLELAEVG